MRSSTSSLAVNTAAPNIRNTTPVFDRFDYISKTPYASVRLDTPHCDKGYAHIAKHDTTCELMTLFVDQLHRGNGHGTRLLQLAEEKMRQAGCTQVRTTILFHPPCFVVTEDWYEKRGYRRIWPNTVMGWVRVMVSGKPPNIFGKKI